MERPLLNERDTPVTDELLAKILAESYPVYAKMLELLTGDEFGLVPEWRYYNDGKAWLCKAVFKKKTVFWLSVWEGYFKISFYFSERHITGIMDLDIDSVIKEELKQAKPFGTLYPVTLEMRTTDQIAGLVKLVNYKKSLK